MLLVDTFVPPCPYDQDTSEMKIDDELLDSIKSDGTIYLILPHLCTVLGEYDRGGQKSIRISRGYKASINHETGM